MTLLLVAFAAGALSVHLVHRQTLRRRAEVIFWAAQDLERYQNLDEIVPELVDRHDRWRGLFLARRDRTRNPR